MATSTLKANHSKSKPSTPLVSERSFQYSDYLKYLYPLLLILIFAKTYSFIYDEKLNMGGDNADYYLLGKAIAKGEGYVNIASINKSPASHFPPGYPVIIAAVMTVFGYDIQTIKMANGFFLIGSVLLVFMLFSRLTRNFHLSFVASLLVLINGTMLSFSTSMYSEVPFVFFTLLSFYFFMKIKDFDNFFKDPNFYVFLIISVFCYYIRTIGISLFGGILLYLLFKRHWKMMFTYMAGIILLASPWIIRNKLLGQNNTYLQQLVMINPYQPEHGYIGPAELFTRFLKNVERYVSKEIPAGVLNFVDVDYTDTSTAPIKFWIAGIVAIGLTAYGLFRLKEKRALFAAFTIGNFGILLLWPDVYFGSRFMIAMIPFFVLFMCLGILELFNQFIAERYFKLKVHPLFLLVLCFLFIPKVKALNVEANGVFIPEVQNYFKTAIWAKENTPKNAVFCVRKPSLFAIYSNRNVTSFLSILDQEEFIKDLESRKVDYVILDALGYTSTSRYLYPVVQNNPLMFPVIKHEKNPDTYILRFNREISFEGQKINGKKEGFGKVIYLMGNIYEGEFKDNKMNGKGKLTYPDKSVYLGEWKDGKRSGKGSYTWSEGVVYEGAWENDVRNGEGVFKMSDGSQYIGSWKNDKRNGQGKYIWPDKTVYDGPWVDDKRVGDAWLYLPNGTRYYGTWSNDALNGEVKVYDKNGRFTGVSQFKNNQPVK